MTWKCKNPECQKTFHLTGRITTEFRPDYPPKTDLGTVTRVIIESPCCPHCQSLNFEEVKDPDGAKKQ
jgi:hypothetical protein